ncbi:MAG: hypothetical protein HY553_16840 [Elusimicrobia bacterium]|nr:hypothetical protein [Elusimicrobiota bacterium]
MLELLRAEDAAAGADEAWAAARAGLHAARARALRAAGRLDAAAVSEIGRRLEAR